MDEGKEDKMNNNKNRPRLSKSSYWMRHLGFGLNRAHYCLILLVCSILTGCNPRELPAVKTLVEENEKAITKQTEEAIRNDPRLHALDEICRQVPLPRDARFVRKAGPDDENLTLSVYYYSDTPYDNARIVWEQYFSQTGWTLVDHRDRGFLKTTEFRSSDYRIVIQYGGMGQGVNYAVDCKTL